MFDPVVFVQTVLALVVAAVVMALGLLVALRLFTRETLEYPALLFITLMGNILTAGLGYIVLVIVARNAVLQTVMFGETPVPTTLIATFWLLALLLIFFLLMVKIAGRTTFGRAFGAVTVMAVLVGGLAFLGSALTMLVMGMAPEAAGRAIYEFFTLLPQRLA